MQFAHFYEYLACSSDQSELFNYSLVRIVLCPLLDLCCADPFIIISPHRMHSTTMWSVATDVDLWSLCVCVCLSVCLSVCLDVGRDSEPCKHDWADRDAVRDVGSWKSKERCIRCAPGILVPMKSGTWREPRPTDMVFTLYSRLQPVEYEHSRLYNQLDELCKWTQPSGAWAVQPWRLWRH